MKQSFLPLLTLGILAASPLSAMAAGSDGGSAGIRPPVPQGSRQQPEQDYTRQAREALREGQAFPASSPTRVAPDIIVDGDLDRLRDLEQELAEDQLRHRDPGSDRVPDKPW